MINADAMMFHEKTHTSGLTCDDASATSVGHAVIHGEVIACEAEYPALRQQMNHFRVPQQGLGRDTAPIQTDSPEVLLFYKGGFCPSWPALTAAT